MFVDKLLGEFEENLASGWASGVRYGTPIQMNDTFGIVPGTSLQQRLVEPPHVDIPFRFLLEITQTFTAAAALNLTISMVGSMTGQIEELFMTKAHAYGDFVAGKWIDFGFLAGQVYETIAFTMKTSTGAALTAGKWKVHVWGGMSQARDSSLDYLEAFN